MHIKQQYFFFLAFNFIRLITNKPLKKREVLTLTSETLTFESGDSILEYELDLIEVNIEDKVLTSQVKVTHTSKVNIVSKLFNKKSAGKFYGSFLKFKNTLEDEKARLLKEKNERLLKEKEENRKLDKLKLNESKFNKVYDFCLKHYAKDTYLTYHYRKKIREDLESISELFELGSVFQLLDGKYSTKIKKLQKQYLDLPLYLDRRNTSFEEKRINGNETYFNFVESNPLTPEQRKACVVDDNWNLVLASAGSGKTSVIVGKAGLLLKNKEVTEDQILILSFASAASEEITERIKDCIVNNVNSEFSWARNIKLEAQTFHKLGCQIIRKSCEKLGEPIPKIFAKDELDSQSDIKNQLIEMLYDNEEQAALISYLASHQKPTKATIEFKSIKEFLDYIESSRLTTLKGEDVKSFEEFTIANFLYLHNVNYTYEKQYPYDTSMVGWTRGYEPDFTITQGENTVYLEHFGVDENDKAPSFFSNPEEYVKKMYLKRDVHKANGTVLEESYSHEMRDGKLEVNLRNKLERKGIVFSETPTNEVLNQIERHPSLSELSKLLYNFLNQFKASQLSLEELKDVLCLKANNSRAVAFYSLFCEIYNRYELFLKQKGKIDFNDMINKSVDYLNNGTYKSSYKRIMVDEFQDISKARMSLVEALVNNGPLNTRVFCVGDDFQAIFSFTGCDIAYIKYFKEYFCKAAQERPLFTTFRFNNQIGEVAKHFIEKNDFQSKKPIDTHQKAITEPMVSLVKTPEFCLLPITFAMNEIIERSGLKKDKNKNVSILVLTRYRKDKKEEDKKEVKRVIASYVSKYPNLSMEVMTCHASKGQGEDYVIILDLYKKGFPSEKTNDPLLDILNSGDDTFGQESYPDAEERRLFYVALTRAKKRVYMVVRPPNVSRFVIELLTDNCAIDVLEDTSDYDGKFKNKNLTICTKTCPKCNSGILERKDKQWHECNQIACDGLYVTCPTCEKGVVLPDSKNKFICSECSHEYKECIRCDGFLMVKTNYRKKSKFLGCAHYKKNGCRNTG